VALNFGVCFFSYLSSNGLTLTLLVGMNSSDTSVVVLEVLPLTLVAPLITVREGLNLLIIGLIYLSANGSFLIFGTLINSSGVSISLIELGRL